VLKTVANGLTKEMARAGACYAVHWKNVALAVWNTRANGETAGLAVDHSNLLKNEYPMFSVIHVVERTAGLPTKEGSERLVQAGRADAHRVAVVGVFLSDAGVFATMMGAFVRSTRMLLGGKLNFVVDHRLDALVAAFVPQHVAGTGVSITPDELAAVITEARKRAALAV
jgi:hypothetical protein